MILNKTTKHRQRYRVLPGSMGNYALPDNHPNHKWHLVEGINRGSGYQGSVAVEYFLQNERGYFPQEAIENLKRFLRDNGYGAWLDSHPGY